MMSELNEHGLQYCLARELGGESYQTTVDILKIQQLHCDFLSSLPKLCAPNLLETL